jgi:hypothetical protein
VVQDQLANQGKIPAGQVLVMGVLVGQPRQRLLQGVVLAVVLGILAAQDLIMAQLGALEQVDYWCLLLPVT